MMKWLSNRENITFLIAVVGFVISIYNFLSSMIQNRTRLEIEVPNVFRIENSRRCLDVIQLKMLNLSKNPVILSRVTVCNDLGCASFGSYRRELLRIEKKTNGILESKRFWYSDVLPIKIEGNGCANLLIMSDGENRILSAACENTIKLHTSKKTVKKKLSFSDFSCLESMSECREPN